jgi:hypothetical protein
MVLAVAQLHAAGLYDSGSSLDGAAYNSSAAARIGSPRVILTNLLDWQLLPQAQGPVGG